MRIYTLHHVAAALLLFVSLSSLPVSAAEPAAPGKDTAVPTKPAEAGETLVPFCGELLCHGVFLHGEGLAFFSGGEEDEVHGFGVAVVRVSTSSARELPA